MILLSHLYGRDPLDILIAKENAVEKRIKGCKGCRHLACDASTTRIYTACDCGGHVGTKDGCVHFKGIQV